MFTNTPSPAVPAVVLLPPVLARRSSTTFYAVNPQLLVLANTATATIFALVFVSAVWAKAASAILALQAHNAVLANTACTRWSWGNTADSSDGGGDGGGSNYT